jgi:hypothetical protein
VPGTQMSAPGPFRPKPGDVLKTPEADYLYGVGELALRVMATAGVEQLPDGEWLNVQGVQLARDGAELKERSVLVRLSAFTRRRPGS